MSRKKSTSHLMRWPFKIGFLAIIVAVAYLSVAYFGLPKFWRHYESRRVLSNSPKVTRTVDGIAGDPVNVALVGTHLELMQAMLAVGWLPADPKSFESGLRIAESVLKHRSYPTAPVSDLYLWGRRQDLAFEQQVGSSAAERNHVRLWNAGTLPFVARPLWIGSVTFDRSVGISHETAQITHHISPDLDGERSKLFAGLRGGGQLSSEFLTDGLGATVHGRNAGGDAYFTDGRMHVGILNLGVGEQAMQATVSSNGQSK